MVYFDRPYLTPSTFQSSDINHTNNSVYITGYTFIYFLPKKRGGSIKIGAIFFLNHRIETIGRSKKLPNSDNLFKFLES